MTENDKELEAYEAEREDETVDVDIHEDAPDPDLTPQSLLEVQDGEVDLDA